MKQSKHPIYRGAFLLTATGLLCRFIGFYYKIFLSRILGAKELGLYQLSLPLLSMGIAFANAGIHTALSKYVAGEGSVRGKTAAKRYLMTGLILSLGLSLLFCIPCYLFAGQIADFFFGEPAITPLLKILLFCIPLECIHGCINGYYYGLQKASVPSGGQCVEQFLRVGSVLGMYYVLTGSGLPFTKTHAVLGLLVGEIGSTLYYLTVLSLRSNPRHEKNNILPRTRNIHNTGRQFFHTAGQLGSMAYPVTANRVLLTGLGSLENILIPKNLVLFGLNNTQALSIYGIYSGMALPMIFFPMVISNSIAVMLLPSISKAKEEGRQGYITHAIHLSFFLCMLFGFICAFFFYYGGPIMGERIFQNQVAGVYIRTLSWLCPFLFLGATLNSILNGLGKTKDTFCLSILGAFVRLMFVQFGIPRFGFRAFLLGILISQISISLLAYLRLYKYTCSQSPEWIKACHTDSPE